jgi:acetylornithine deacetylase/succinyl-diaminopimelate desuccinylase-like protein
MDSATFEKFKADIFARKAEMIKDLAEAVAIQSVSSDPARRPDTIKMMEVAADKIRALGGSAELHPIGDEKPGLPMPPILLGEIKAADASAPTVLVYGHLDVQPAAKEDGWATDPFVLTEKDDKLYGRGSTDDKGPVLGWLAAVKSHQDLGIPLPCNIKFCLEGMEESGSLGLQAFIEKVRAP